MPIRNPKDCICLREKNGSSENLILTSTLLKLGNPVINRQYVGNLESVIYSAKLQDFSQKKFVIKFFLRNSKFLSDFPSLKIANNKSYYKKH